MAAPSGSSLFGKLELDGATGPGEHKAIVSKNLFDQVQEQFAASRHENRRTRNTARHAALAGLIFDDNGNPMTPTYSRKSGSREYGYYVSAPVIIGTPSRAGAIPRVPAQAIEDLVGHYLKRLGLADTCAPTNEVSAC